MVNLLPKIYLLFIILKISVSLISKRVHKLPFLNSSVSTSTNANEFEFSEELLINQSSLIEILKNWKILYESQIESLNFLVGRRFNRSGHSSFNNEGLLKFSDPRMNDVIDLNLFQLQNLEDFRKEIVRTEINNELTAFVREIINKNQYIQKCTVGNVIGCRITEDADLTTVVHQIAFCLNAALVKHKFLVIDNVRISPNVYFHDIFTSLNPGCDGNQVKSTDMEWISFYGYDKDMYPNIPSTVFNILETYHTSPAVWWVSTLVGYVFRLNSDGLKIVSNIRFDPPIVGICLKNLNEINFLNSGLDEAMFWANLYFKKLEIRSAQVKRRIYINVRRFNDLIRIKRRYKAYDFFSSSESSQSNRHIKLIQNIYALSQTSYIVGTFSYEVCRLAFELKNSKSVDQSFQYQSLDVPYEYYGKRKDTYSLILPHTMQNGWVLTIGRRLELIYNHRNGYCEVRNIKDNIPNTLVPCYKIKENLEIADYEAF